MVRSAHAKEYGTLHGGAIAALIDIISTGALVSLDRRAGVSITINVQYLRLVDVGKAIIIDAVVSRSAC
jgi:uncharacterized protein (TIGR00369 family)